MHKTSITLPLAALCFALVGCNGSVDASYEQSPTSAAGETVHDGPADGGDNHLPEETIGLAETIRNERYTETISEAVMDFGNGHGGGTIDDTGSNGGTEAAAEPEGNEGTGG